MAFGLRYESSYWNRKDFIRYGIEFYKRDYTGVSTSIEVASSAPVTERKIGSRDNQYDVIFGKELEFAFFIKDDSFDDLIESYYKDFYVVHKDYTNDRIIFVGWTKPENITRQFHERQNIFTIPAIDGLGDLKDIPFQKDNGNYIVGRFKILEIIKFCLGKLEYEVNLDFEVMLNTYHDKMSYDECPLMFTKVSTQEFIEVDEAKIEADDCYTVIEKCLRNFHVIFQQCDGYWKITNPNELDSFKYRFNWSDLSLIPTTNGNLEYIDGHVIGAGSPEYSHVFGDTNFIYVGARAEGLLGYTIDGNGNLIFKSQYNPVNYVYGVYADGSYVYAAVGATGLMSFSVNPTTGGFTPIDTDHQGSEAYLEVTGDGNFIYCLMGYSGIRSYSVDGAGNLTYIDYDYQGSGNYYGVYANNDFIFCACSDGLRVYEVDGVGNLTYKTVDHQGSKPYLHVWGDDNYIYVANDTDGIRSYSYDTDGTLHFIDVAHEGSASYKGGWSDGDFICVSCYDEGIRSFSVDSDGNLTYVDQDDQGNNHRLEVWKTGDYWLITAMGGGLRSYKFEVSGIIDHSNTVNISEMKFKPESNLSKYVPVKEYHLTLLTKRENMILDYKDSYGYSWWKNWTFNTGQTSGGAFDWGIAFQVSTATANTIISKQFYVTKGINATDFLMLNFRYWLSSYDLQGHSCRLTKYLKLTYYVDAPGYDKGINYYIGTIREEEIQTANINIEIKQSGYYQIGLLIEWPCADGTYGVIQFLDHPIIRYGTLEGDEVSQKEDDEEFELSYVKRMEAGKEIVKLETLFADSEDPKLYCSYFDLSNDLVSTWNRYSKSDDRPLIDLYLQTLQNNSSEYADYASFTIYDFFSLITPEKVLILNDKYYKILGWNKDYRASTIIIDAQQIFPAIADVGMETILLYPDDFLIEEEGKLIVEDSDYIVEPVKLPYNIEETDEL